ncbi:MAG: hypothetical protein AAF676_18810, partial [Pseudomonadota bacterium]
MRMFLMSFALAAGAAGQAFALAVLPAQEAYYTFGAGVSANTERLLSDKATVIGFPGLDTVSFMLFDPAQIAADVPESGGFQAFLVLEHDPDELAGTLIPATAARPVSVSAYAVDGVWDPAGGNLADIDYGAGGASVVATTMVGDPGLYSWDVTDLVSDWRSGVRGLTALALSGVFGNVNQDDFNSYAAMHTVGSQTGVAPFISVQA